MEPGQQITPNLRLVRLLGQGGMGAVWVADHLGIGTQVAVKFMWRQFAEHPQFIERFRREATAAASLKNPHVAQVFDHGVTTTGEPYIVMELLEGEDLGKRVKRQGPLPPPLVAEILSQAARALGKAHQLGIVHRDIKADNIFLSDMEGDVFVKILDFGIAKISDDSNLSVTSTSNVIGTPLFMSPEQFVSAKHVDHRADLWSLAVVAYLALTGRVPFLGDSIGAVSILAHTGDYPPPSTLRPGLPPDVDAWFQRMFRRNPAERYQSAREMADALKEAVAGRGTRPSITTPPAGDRVSAPGNPAVPATSHVVSVGEGSPAPIVSTSNPAGPQPVVSTGGGVPGTSGATLGGKSTTLGGGTEKRRFVIPLLVGAIALFALVVFAAVVRPWAAPAHVAQPSSDTPVVGAAPDSPSGSAVVSPVLSGSGTSPTPSASTSATEGPSTKAAPTSTSITASTTKPAVTRPSDKTKPGHGDDDPGF